MEIVVQVLLGLSVIILGVLLWKSAQRWTWLPLLLVPIVFIEAIVFMALVAQSGKARVAWQKIIVELEGRLETATNENELLKFGEPGREGEQIAVVPLELTLQKLRTDAGRVWRGLIPAGENNGEFTLTMPGNAAAAAAAAGAPAAGGAPDPATQLVIPNESIIYGFSEQIDPNLSPPDNRIPQTYLGEFKVIRSDATSITVKATTPLASFTTTQREGIRTSQSWAIYEMTPIDGHDPFIRDGSRPRDDAIFGDIDEAFVNAALANTQAATMQSYLKDGKRAQADDPPEARWIKIEFTKNYEVTVDSQDSRNALEGGYFDTLGQAVDVRLQIMEEGQDKVSFRSGEQLIVKRDAADELITSGDATLIDEIFVRPLNDYEEYGRHVFERLDKLSEKEIVLGRETATLQEVSDTNDALLIAGQEVKIKLEAELKQYRIEKGAIDQHVQKLLADQKAIKTRMAALYRSNLQISRELQQAQMKLKERIDRRTLSAGL